MADNEPVAVPPTTGGFDISTPLGLGLGFGALLTAFWMEKTGFGKLPEVELHCRLVGVVDVVLELLEFFLDEIRVIAAVAYGRQHGIRDVPDAAQTCGHQREVTRALDAGRWRAARERHAGVVDAVTTAGGGKA